MGDPYLPFLRTPQDLLDTAACYFEAGLKSTEPCVWAVSDPISQQQAEDALRREIPGFDRRGAGQIELLAGGEWYLKGDEFDLQRITGGWKEKLSAALARGYDGMRVGERKCVLDGNETLEGVLRVRTRTRPISRRPENDRALHLFATCKQDRRHA